MTWFRVDDTLPDHKKVRRLGRDRLPAIGLWTLTGAWVAFNGNEGFVPDEVIHRYDPRHRLAQKLVAVGLWERAEHDSEYGYTFHDWFDSQPSLAEIEKKKANNRERQRRLRLRRAGIDPTDPGPADTPTDDDVEPPEADEPDAGTHGVTPASRNGARNALRPPSVTQPRPDPTRPDLSTSKGDMGGGAPDATARDSNALPRATPHDPPCEKPCRRCQAARLATEQAEQAAEQTAAETRAAELRARAACRLCDADGWTWHDPNAHRHGVTNQRCDHRPHLTAVQEATA